MRRRLTKSQFERANESATLRRFQEMALSGTQVALRRRFPPLVYWFEQNDVGQDGKTGQYLRDTDLAVISLVVDGKPSVLFYLVGTSIDTCTFAYDLYPRQLTKAVQAMRRAKLGRLIRPAAAWALREMPRNRRPILESALRLLLPAKGRRSSMGAVEQGVAVDERRRER
jgi:hypothetical protein